MKERAKRESLTLTGSIVKKFTVLQFLSDRMRSTWAFWQWFFAVDFSFHQKFNIQRKLYSINSKSRKQATFNISSYRLICKVSLKLLKLGTNGHPSIVNKMARNDFFIKPVFDTENRFQCFDLRQGHWKIFSQTLLISSF